ncbi:MAG TPA: multiheme c-type cytochrome [Candidatus Polarisedimenticolaceae bacterium]
MHELIRDKEHLFRLALLFVVGIVLFLVVRGLFVPEGFGEIGHYRVGALEDNRDHPLTFAGRAVCADCHGDVVEAKSGGKHAGIGCEACHGPQAAHARSDDPSSAKPEKPDPVNLCLVCHRNNVAKPAGFPRIDPNKHNAGASCHDCHAPHNPGLG